ncbi:MAG: L-ribulose-5-phosphate 4-epimerase AraD [Oscillospiraceae bacterium]|jgi:L-ribulose-5-phosphate 4-epimerase|nr:L-ribulose-5-phosphate 4-epimerase AraD [Oscillospiraceae bacterium]
MYEELKRRVFNANMLLARSGLVILTWGNVSEADREAGVFAIKPSGVSYDEMKAEDVVIVSLESGERIEGKMNPSSDTKTHLALYRAFPKAGGICHCHSTFATAYAQASHPIPCLGTTHADVFFGEVPVTRALTKEEIDKDYEGETGMVIAEAFAELDPAATPGVLVRQHGPFTWGKNGVEAVEHAQVLEQTAKMAWIQNMLDPDAESFNLDLLHKHYERKHGANATYGQSSHKTR